MHAWYFTPERIADNRDRERGFSDVEPRTAMSVMNAVTRLARSWPAHRQQETGIALSNHLAAYFGMPTMAADEPIAN